jgi:hypothetical protein
LEKKTVTGIMLTLLLTNVLILTSNIQSTQSTEEPPTVEWSRTYGGGSSDYAYSLVQTSDGGHAMAGGTKSYGVGGYDSWLVRTDSNGNKLWDKTYGGTNDDCAYSLVQTSDGGYALAGSGFANFIKTDASGNMQINKAYGGSASCIVQANDGGYALAGILGSDFWLVKTNSAGNTQWTKTYRGGSNQRAHSLVQTSDEGYALVGYIAATGLDCWLVKTDANGNEQWNKTIQDNISGRYEGRSIVETSDGGYAIAIDAYTGEGFGDFWLVKTDAYGNEKWNRTCGGSDGDYAYSLVQTSDGGYALTGFTRSYGAGAEDFWLIKLSPPPPQEIKADLDLEPNTLNLAAKGQWITAYIQLPEGYNASDIDASTILLNGTIAPELDPKYDFVTNASEYLVDHNGDGVLERMVKFDRAGIASWIYQSVGMQHQVSLTITGQLTDETPFEGTDIIFVVHIGGSSGRRK